MIRINDKSKEGIYSSNMELIDNFTDYSSKNLDFDKPVEIDFLDDENNAKNPLGTTAHYNPEDMKITIYVTGRHLKDILRSISHELIHHVQNCRGDLDHKSKELGYAQKDKHMRGMEHEAYTMGNIMNFRDFEDNYKRENKQMKTSLKELKKIINEEVEAVITEQESVMGVGTMSDLGGGDARKAALGSPEGAGRFLASQNNSAYVNEDEGLLVQKSVQKWLRASQADPNIAKRFIDAFKAGGGGRLRFKASFNPFSDVKPRFVDRQLRIMQQYAKSAGAPAGAGGKQQPGTTGPVAGAKGTKKGTRKGKIRYRVCKNVPFKVGCKGNIVQGIQRLLHAALKLKSPVDSFADKFYGGGTEKAVEAFQRKNGIKPTGVIDNNTLKALSKSKPKVSKAVAQKLGQRVGQQTASPAGPTAGGMTRVQAIRTARQNIIPKLRRVRERSYKRGLVNYLETGLKELIDVKKMDPAKAYRTLLNIFGQGGVKYISPNYRSQSAMPDEQQAKMSDTWKRNYENALNKTIDQL
tara:strand:+ start:1350 stop:2921 length:1572 start_codon:yes stop_codon:yes gene_type:complete